MLKRHKSRDDTELDACIAATLQECRNAGCVEDELALALLEALGHLILQCQECSGSEALRLTNCLRQEIAAHMARKMMADFELVPLMIEVDQYLVMQAFSSWRELFAMVLPHDDDETPMVLRPNFWSLALDIETYWAAMLTSLA